MLLCDVNVFIHAFREDSTRHHELRPWVERMVAGPEAYAVADLVLSGFVRVVTRRGAFRSPSPLDRALTFAGQLRDRPNCVTIAPGPRHWGIFTDLCRRSAAHGNLVPDAYLAALAIEHGCEFVSCDRDFARLPDLRWRNPVD